MWLAVVFESHPAHLVAQKALAAATKRSPAVFCRSTEQSFLRLVSTPAIHRAYGTPAMNNDEALGLFRALTGLPQVEQREEPEQIAPLWHRLASGSTPSPKVWMDAYLAAFAISGGMRFLTLDRDFERYGRMGLKCEFLVVEGI